MNFITKSSRSKPRLTRITSKWWRKLNQKIPLPTAALSCPFQCSRPLPKTIHSCKLRKTWNGQPNVLTGTSSHQSALSALSTKTTRTKKFSRNSFPKVTKVMQSTLIQTVELFTGLVSHSLEHQINKSLITFLALWPTQLTARTKLWCMVPV